MKPAKIQRKPDAETAAPMTPRELRQRMLDAGLGTASLAARLGMTQRTVQLMLRGELPIRYLVAYAVRHL